MRDRNFILNGQAHGPVAERLIACNFDVNCLRPYQGNDGRSYITSVNQAGKLQAVPTGNATTLRKDDWILLDEAIVKVSRERLRAVADLRSAGLTFTIPNGMGKTVLQTETMGDINDATVSMDALREAQNDRPEFELVNLPLPIIHKDFHFSARQIATSRSGGSPLDTTMAEMAGRKVAEEAEKMLLGLSTTADLYAYGGGTIQGYTDFVHRTAAIITAPTAAGWVGATFLADVMAMKQASQNRLHYGPWMVYVAPAWDQYLDDDFKAASDITIRERVKKVEGISDIRTLDFLTGFTVLLVQMTSDVVREVVGMDITTVQWETVGGLKLNFKVMAILVPQLRADFNGHTGIIHGAPLGG